MTTNDSFDNSDPTARQTDDWPAGVALMYLDTPEDPLSADQVAFLLGDDASYIEALAVADEEQAAQWTRDALDVRNGNPDPALLDASAHRGHEGLEEACLGEARSWTMAAQTKRAALDAVTQAGLTPNSFDVAPSMERVQALAKTVAELQQACAANCSAEPDDCPRHGRQFAETTAALDNSVADLRTTLVEAHSAARRIADAT